MHDARAYEAETDGIVVRVRPSYLAGQSDPDAGRWVWAYQVEIVNLTGVSVQLMARRWVITDARGHVEEVRGPGVIGEQPTILPGESYAYASGCPLGTASGWIGGLPLPQVVPATLLAIAASGFLLLALRRLQPGFAFAGSAIPSGPGWGHRLAAMAGRIGQGRGLLAFERMTADASQQPFR